MAASTSDSTGFGRVLLAALLTLLADASITYLALWAGAGSEAVDSGIPARSAGIVLAVYLLGAVALLLYCRIRNHRFWALGIGIGLLPIVALLIALIVLP